MDHARLNALTDVLIEYVLREMDNLSDVDEAQRHRIKAMKITIQEKAESFDLCIGMGMAEAVFGLNGEKKSGALGSVLERLIKQWILRTLNQEALRLVVEK